MSITLIIIGLALLAFIIYVAISYKKMKNMPDTPNSQNIKVLHNKNFKAQIKSGITLVDFWAPWCGPCKMMTPILNQLAENKNHKATIAKVNVDHQQPLAAKYKVRNIPTIVMFKEGKEINRYVGIKNEKFLLKEIEKHQ